MDQNYVTYAALAALAVIFVAQRLRNRKAPGNVVRDKISAGARIVDVRSPSEFAGGAYRKAKNIPLDLLPSRLGELTKDQPIVLYCASGMRSARAARLLKRSGFADVTNAGGLADMPR